MKHSTPARQRILEAAEELFSARGYAATGVQEIADLARINKRMIFYYFGSKQGLYSTMAAASFKQVLHPAVESGRRALDEGDPAVALEEMIGTYYDAMSAHPRFVRFITWEAAAEWSMLNTLDLREFTDPVRALLEDILRRGMAQGVFASDLDVEAAWRQITGAVVYHFMFRPRARVFVEEDFKAVEVAARHRRETIKFVLRAVLNHASPDGMHAGAVPAGAPAHRA
ncbi:MAG: TetR family transcriptional regulator [Chloroflexi bacterium]|nr:TetR family transcriptional regulator [Chloroflexota bacterium]